MTRNLTRERLDRLTRKCDLIINVSESVQNSSLSDKVEEVKALAREIKNYCKAGKIVGLDFNNCSKFNFPYFMVFEFFRLINEVRDKTIMLYSPVYFRSYMAKARNTLIVKDS